MDPFKRTVLLGAQASLQQVTQAEVQTELPALIDLMKADTESQPAKAAEEAEKETPPASSPSY